MLGSDLRIGHIQYFGLIHYDTYDALFFEENKIQKIKNNFKLQCTGRQMNHPVGLSCSTGD